MTWIPIGFWFSVALGYIIISFSFEKDADLNFKLQTKKELPEAAVRWCSVKKVFLEI